MKSLPMILSESTTSSLVEQMRSSAEWRRMESRRGSGKPGQGRSCIVWWYNASVLQDPRQEAGMSLLLHIG